jgi:hypothetical protein
VFYAVTYQAFTWLLKQFQHAICSTLCEAFVGNFSSIRRKGEYQQKITFKGSTV